jgi:signal transduction histidine kinase
VRFLVGVVAIGAAYGVLARGSEALLLTGPSGVFWPATGFGIAILYLGGLRWWPGVLLGELLSRRYGLIGAGPALAESVGNIARAVVAAVILLRLVGPRARMDRLVHVGAVLVAVAAGSAISATVAMVALSAGGVLGAPAGVFWRSWWVGDIAGGVVVVPLALAWVGPLALAWRGRGAWEGALMIASVAGLSALALSGEQPLLYLVSPAFIWAALRFGPQGATAAVAVAAEAAVWATSNEWGPFVQQPATDSALNLQLYIVFSALTTQCLAAIVAERRRAALEASESQAQIAEAGERERRRLEAELHDSAQNRLTALQIRLALAQERARPNGPELAAELEVLIHDADAVADELRRIARGAAPPVLAAEGVAAALSAEGAHCAIPVEVIGDQLGRSDPEIEVATYLCCLESIQNAAKHAGREAVVTVRMRRRGDWLTFDVHDTGCGFDSQSVTPGAGLAGLRARVETIGGHVDIITAPGRGTSVAGDVPWPPRS